MNTKVLEMTETVVARRIDLASIPAENEKAISEIEENTEVKELRNYKKEYKLVTIFNQTIKRIIDIAGSLFGIILLLPITISVAILNFINKDHGPIFYSHTRIGKDGKLFRMYKFRTMVVDADERLAEMLEKNEEIRKEWEENRKLKKDPRITKIGGFLRKTSLDEFPQFFNVLKGEMSLVGPRAVVEDEIEKFGIYKKDVLSVKPGITGYWAANGRSDTTYEERVYMEYKYVDKFSILMDMKILFKTVSSVIKREGAV